MAAKTLLSRGSPHPYWGGTLKKKKKTQWDVKLASCFLGLPLSLAELMFTILSPQISKAVRSCETGTGM